MMTLLFFLGLNGLFNGIGNFFNGIFGISTVAPTDPPTLVGAYGNIYDLPNSNVVELPPTLPTMQNPIAVSVPTNPFSNFFNSIGSLFGSNSISVASVGSSEFPTAINSPFSAIPINNPVSQYYP
jgi:hypothetical protein